MNKTLREQLKAVLSEVQKIADGAKGEDGKHREFTEEETKNILELKGKADGLKAKIKDADQAKALADELAADSGDADEVPSGTQSKSLQPYTDSVKDRPQAPASMGEAFVKSDAYTQFFKEHPSGIGEGTPVSIKGVRVGGLDQIGRKADPAPLQADIALPQPVRLPTVDLTYPQPLTFLDMISRGSIGGNSFEYLQITAVQRNAALVPDEILPNDTTLKPLSDLSTNLADAKVYTYADGYTVTNQLLADAPAMASYLNNQLSYNINSVIADKLLNGTGANGQPTGLLNTDGVQHQAAAGDDPVTIPTTVRKALTSLSKINAPVTGMLLSPEDAEALDLMQDGQKRFFGNGPFGSGPNTLWGRPWAVEASLPQGTALVGNLKTITLLDREGLSVLAFNQHADYARRNLVYVRAELRAAQAIFKPAEIVVCDLGTAPVTP